MRHQALRLLPLAALAVTLGLLTTACGGGGGGGRPKGGPATTITAPTGGTLSGDIRIDYILVDPQSDLAQIKVSWSTNGGNRWRGATEANDPASEGTVRLTTSPEPGVPHVFVWNSLLDVGPRELPNTRVRIEAYDDKALGKKGLSPTFILDNRALVPLIADDVSDAMSNSVLDQIRIDMNKPVDSSTLRYGTAPTDTMAVYQDTNTTPGPPYSAMTGTVDLANGDMTLIFTPSTPFVSRAEVHVAMTSDMMDTVGRGLDASLGYPSDPPSHTADLPNQVFEYRFVPDVGPNVSRYNLQPGTDPWFIDVDTFGTFDNDRDRHGMGSPDPLVNAWARDLLLGDILGWTAVKYRRTQTTGGPQSGAWLISFTAQRPPGVAGMNFNRMCLGLTLGNLWGAAWFDPGNRFMEDDCRRANPPVGVFTGSVTGIASTLSPSLSGPDLTFLDGTYVLGSNSTMDARFLRVRAAIGDWSHAIAFVTAHEIGHSVGLDHDGSSTLNVMYPWADPANASNTGTRFSSMNASILNTNLGIVP